MTMIPSSPWVGLGVGSNRPKSPFAKPVGLLEPTSLSSSLVAPDRKIKAGTLAAQQAVWWLGEDNTGCARTAFTIPF